MNISHIENCELWVFNVRYATRRNVHMPPASVSAVASTFPFPCLPENNERMKAWLLERYAASTFNTCPHRPLQCMAGPPIHIHVDADANPKVFHTAASIPLHWQQPVYDDIIRDEALGIIERVPHGEPTRWCY